MQTSSVVAVTAGLGGGGLGVGGVMGMGAPSYTLQIILLALTQCELFRILNKICRLQTTELPASGHWQIVGNSELRLAI